MFVYLRIAVALLFLAPGLIRSETGPVRLEALIKEALEANPGLRAARERLKAAEEGPAQAKALPDPVVEAEVMTRHVETRAGPMEERLSVSQEVPFFGKRGLRARAAEAEAETARQALRAEELKVRAELSEAYYELFALRRAGEILREQVELLRHSARVAEKKYAVGRGPQAMAFRAQAELSRMQNEVLTADQEAKSAETRMNALLGRPAWETVGKLAAPEHPHADLEREPLRERALRERPELRALKALEGKTEAARRLAARRFFPDLMAGYEYTRIGNGTTATPFDGRDAQSVMAGLRLPLWLGANRAGLREARARETAASLDREDLENRTLSELEDLLARAETAARLHAVDEATILPQFRAAVKATLSGYEADAVGFLELLDAERALLEAELGHVRHLAMFWTLKARLERVVGGPL